MSTTRSNATTPPPLLTARGISKRFGTVLVAIARALDVEARVIVLDEPTSSLDRDEVAQLFTVLRRLREQRLGIVFIT